MSIIKNIYDSYRRPATVYQSFVTDYFEEKTALDVQFLIYAFVKKYYPHILGAKRRRKTEIKKSLEQGLTV